MILRNIFFIATVSVTSSSPLSGLLDSIEHKKDDHRMNPSNVIQAPGSDGDNAQLDAELLRGGGLYKRPPPGSSPQWLASLNHTVLAVSCNYAVRDILLNWACHADRLGLNFLLLAMDAELAAAARGPWAHLIPATYYSPTVPAGFTGRAINPHVHNVWRNGQFNAVSFYKLAAVARVLERGYRVVFSDIDVVFFNDPMPNLFPRQDSFSEPVKVVGSSSYTEAGVLLPLADFTYQQNVCGWIPGKGWPTTGPKGEGNTGFYVMHPTKAMRTFLAGAMHRCAKYPKLDDQTNLFDELRENWLGGSSSSSSSSRHVKRSQRSRSVFSSPTSSSSHTAMPCHGSESEDHPISGAFTWPTPSSSETGSSSSGSSTHLGTTDDDGVLRVCPLPRLPFATGFAHRDLATWHSTLKGYGVAPVLLHFNCLGRGGGHDAKRRAMEAVAGAWVWDDGRMGGDGSTAPLTPSSSASASASASSRPIPAVEGPGGTCLVPPAPDTTGTPA